jgi:hypothetical protein
MKLLPLRQTLHKVIYFLTACTLLGCESTKSLLGFSGDKDGISRISSETRFGTDCTLIGSVIEIPGQVQQAELNHSSDTKKYTLYYETRTRNGTKSILQPLDFQLRNREDGIAIGDKKLRNIRQFKTSTDQKKQIWISYKAQQRNSELTSGVVEFLPNEASKDLIRQILPGKRNESLQELWILSNRTLGSQVSIVTRFNLNTDAPDTNTYFRWYYWDTSKNSIKVMSEQKLSKNVPSQTHFEALEENLEPFAFAVMGAQNNSLPNQSQNFKVSLWRPFLSTPFEATFSQSKSPLTDLTVEKINSFDSQTWLITWMQEAGSEGSQTLKWKTINAISNSRQINETVQKINANRKASDEDSQESQMGVEQDSMSFTPLVSEPEGNLKSQQAVIAWWSPSEHNSSAVRVLSIQKNTRQTVDVSLPQDFSRVIGIGPLVKNKVTIILGKEVNFKQIESGSLLKFCQIAI